MNIFCEQNQNEYVQIDCGIDQAGIVAFAFIDPSVPTPSKQDLESEGWWTNLLNQSPPQLYVATKTRGEYMGGTPTEEDGFGKESTQITGAAHELTLEYEGIDENWPFTEGINSKKWKGAGITNGGVGFFVDAPITPYGKLQIPRSITAGAFWQMVAKWQSFANPLTFNAPDNIFEE